MIPNGKPENLSPVQRTEIITSFKHRKLVRQILHGAAAVSVMAGLIPFRYDVSLFGLSRGAELWIFFGIAATVLGISVLFWRCPYCGWHFLWRMDPKTCWNCGAQLVVPELVPAETDEIDFRYYIKVRERNSLKFTLYFIFTMITGLGLILIIPGYIRFIVAPAMGASIWILDAKFHKCPKCGKNYIDRWGGLFFVPQECPNCKTWLKYYPSDTSWR